MTTDDATLTLTDFLQHSGDVLPAVERGEVVLRRRTGDDLVLLSRRHWEAIGASLRVLAEASRAAQASAPASGTNAWFSLPWLSLLTPDDQVACVADLGQTAVTALATGRLDDLWLALARWRATALATWDDTQQRDRQGSAAGEARPSPRP